MAPHISERNPKRKPGVGAASPGFLPGSAGAFACALFETINALAGPALGILYRPTCRHGLCFLACRRRPQSGGRHVRPVPYLYHRSSAMACTAPVVCEVCAGLEVTAYLTAEI